jgi:hypothetical protein
MMAARQHLMSIDTRRCREGYVAAMGTSGHEGDGLDTGELRRLALAGFRGAR